MNELEKLSHLLSEQILKSSEPRRLLHGRGGCFEGFQFLNVDLFDSVLVVMLHESRSEEWGLELSELMLSNRVKGVVVQDRSQRPSVQKCYGEVPNSLEVFGEGLKYELSPMQIKNPGWFLDMRIGREWVKNKSTDAKVLNLFSYTCGFSAMALKHGAELVINMDMNKSVLSRGKRNHQLNGLDLNKAKFFDHNVLKSFGKIKKYAPYDVVIIDPPSIQTGSFQLRRDYPKLLSRLCDWLKEGGEALLCCNDPLVDDEEFKAWILGHFKGEKVVNRLPQAEDFPEQNRARALKVYELKKI